MMPQVSIQFLRAMNHSLTLFYAGVIMALIWCYFRLPDAQILMVIFAFIASSVLYDVEGWLNRLKLLLLMAPYAAALQFIIGICAPDKILRVILPAAFSFFTLRTFDNRNASCCVLLVGYIGFYSGSGFIPAMDRAIGLFVAVISVMLATSMVGLVHQREGYDPAFSKPFSFLESLRISLQLGLTTFLAYFFNLPQAPWVMLSVIFIYSATNSVPDHAYFVKRRIIGVPVGLCLGAMYMNTFTFFDYRFVYLVPLFGALAFFCMYYFRDYFSFTALFMVAFSIYVDWATGSMREFNVVELISARSFATLIGSCMVLLFEYYFLPQTANPASAPHAEAAAAKEAPDACTTGIPQ